jgi:gliding motility-associated-like protein
VPNAFSPDNNGINEKFNPNGQYITNYNIKIFNRWGELLFESSECLEPWDGKFKGEICQQDAYMYVIEAKGNDNKLYNLRGTFHLLR